MRLSSFLRLVSCLVVCHSLASGAPVINEFLFHPKGTPAEDRRREWIEVHNPDAEPVDLSGWRFRRGVDFTFPKGTTISAGGFLIVSAEPKVFADLPQGLAGIVLGGWKGRLSNGGETITLTDAQGKTVDEVTYATEGDWASRAKDIVRFGFQGWTWVNEADGGGKSYERVKAKFLGDTGQNWAVSLGEGGSPGATNSVAKTDVPPAILGTKHRPRIPRGGQPVLVSARIIDDGPKEQVRASLVWRRGTEPEQRIAMQDKDGDGEYEATIPGSSDKTLVEFYLEAEDGASRRTWPAPARTSDPGAKEPTFGQVTNCLLQFDNTYDASAPWKPGAPPVYRILMTDEERNSLQRLQRGSPLSDAAFNATFISVDGTGESLHYRCHVRNRGQTSRVGPPNNYHIAFPDTDPWNGRGSFQLNCRYPFSQALGSALFQRAGVATTEAVRVNVLLNAANMAQSGQIMYGSFARAEPMNSAWVERWYPHDPDGNLYRLDDHSATNGSRALGYDGERPEQYSDTVLKRTHEEEGDYSDFIRMADTLSNAPAEGYVDAVAKVIDLDQWRRFLAINILMSNLEGGLATGRADDFGMYRGVLDPRFHLVPHDLDTVMGLGEGSFGAVPLDIHRYESVGGLERLFRDPAFLRPYYETLLRMMDEFFKPEVLNPLIDQTVGGWVPAVTLSSLKQFVLNRRLNVLSQIPRINGVTPVDQPLKADADAVSLTGTFHVAQVGSVTVNDLPAKLNYRAAPGIAAGTWMFDSPRGFSRPGFNVFTIKFWSGSNGSGDLVETKSQEVFRESAPGGTVISGEVQPGAPRGSLRVIAPNFYVSGVPWMVRADLLDHTGALRRQSWRESAKSTMILSDLGSSSGSSSSLAGGGFTLYQGSGQGSVRILSSREAVPLLSSGVSWRFWQNLEPPSADWKKLSFSDQTWISAPSPFAFPPPSPNGTYLAPVAGRPAVYFRRKLNLVRPTQFQSVTLRLRYGDSAAVWVNEKRALLTEGLPEEINASTRSTRQRTTAERAGFRDHTLDSKLFVDGENILAVEVRQGPTAAEPFNNLELYLGTAFDMELLGVRGQGDVGSFSLRVVAGTYETERLMETANGLPVTVKGGALSKDETWSGLVWVESSVTVPKGMTLTLAPGALLLLTPGVGFTVAGKLEAVGSAEKPISLVGKEGAEWGGIFHDQGSTGRYAFCLIRRAARGLTARDASLVVEDSVLFDADPTTGAHLRVLGPKASLICRRTNFQSAPIGAEVIEAAALVEDCSFSFLGRADFPFSGIVLFGQPPDRPARVSRCTFTDCHGAAINVEGSTAELAEIVVRGSNSENPLTNEAIRLVGANAVISSSLLVDAKVGVTAQHSRLTLRESTIATPTGVALLDENSTARIQNTILRGTEPLRAANPAKAIVTFSHLSRAWDGEGNLAGDPGLADPEKGDYQLRQNSGCRDAGDPASPKDVDGSRADIGVYPYLSPVARYGTEIRWVAAESPYRVTGDAYVAAGMKWVVEPGVSVYFDPGRRLTIQGVARVLGQPLARVRFSSDPKATPVDDPLLPGEELGPPKWGGVRIVDSLSPDNVVQYADFIDAQPEDNQGALGVIRSQCLVDHCAFRVTRARMLYGRNCSLTVRHCVFPDMFASADNPRALGLADQVEQLRVEHPLDEALKDDPRFEDGMPVGGHFRVHHNDFHGNKGSNDVFHAESGRWGQTPVLDCRYNRFLGPVGDCHIHLDGDAYIASNLFENGTKDALASDRGYSSAVLSGDRVAGATVVLARNHFRNLDHAIDLRRNSSAIFEHNTCVDFHPDYTRFTGADQKVGCSAVNLFTPEENGTPAGDGVYLGFNVFMGSLADPARPNRGGFPRLIGHADPSGLTSKVEIHRNLIDSDLIDRAIGLRHEGGVLDPKWGTGNLLAKFDYAYSPGEPTILPPHSPALALGMARDFDWGASIAEGAFIAGGPLDLSPSKEATFTIGGPGIFAFRWRLDGGAWSEPLPIGQSEFPRQSPTERAVSLALKNLANGRHALEAIGQDFAGNWQSESGPLRRQWTVDESLFRVLISEVRAATEGRTDEVELVNLGARSVNLSGWRLADNRAGKDGFPIPAGDPLAPEGRLVIKLNAAGFALDADGDSLFLLRGAEVADQVDFGPQAVGYTIGRVGRDLRWTLCRPTLGAENEPVPTGLSDGLRITEIFASGEALFEEDWLEIANLNPWPVALSGVSLTDSPSNPRAFVFRPLSFIGPKGFLKLIADGDSSAGPNHLPFAIDANGESLTLLDGDSVRDLQVLGSQTTDHSQSRDPSGALVFNSLPTDGFDPAMVSQATMEMARALLRGLRVTEILAGAKELNFVEIRNVGETPLNLKGVRLEGEIGFQFPSLTLAPGKVTLIVSHASEFRARFGQDAPIAGEYTGKLDDAGALRLRLPEPFGANILAFRYDNAWLPGADGHSLEIVDPLGQVGSWSRQAGWKPSELPGGSPDDRKPGEPLTFVRWASERELSGAGDDADGDGLVALMEYALNRDPKVLDVLPALELRFEEVQLVAVIRMGQDLPPGVKLSVEASDDLKAWREVASKGPGEPWKAQAVATADGAAKVVLGPRSPFSFHRLHVWIP